MTKSIVGCAMIFAVSMPLAPLIAPMAAASECADDINPADPSVLDQEAPLRTRVTAPSREIVQIFREGGATDAVAHRLTDDEWTKVEAALAQLPELHRKTLRRHLRHLSFIDTQAGTGSALTSIVDTCDGSQQFDITLRSNLLHDSLSEFLTRKEGSLFSPDGSEHSVHINAGGSPALLYILLHETTHVVDRSGAAPEALTGPSEAIWLDGARTLSERYTNNIVSRIRWRGGTSLPISKAPQLYAGLVETPFVSLYAATAASEDLAELVAWQQLAMRHQVELSIEIRDERGKIVQVTRPLETPQVRARFNAVARLLSHQ